MPARKSLCHSVICTVVICTAVMCITNICAAQTDVTSKLADCIEQQQWSAASELIDKLDAAQINAAQPDGMTALHWAVWHDQLTLVEQLLAHDADAKLANRYGVEPLALACSNGNAKIVSRLLDRGASVTAQSKGGETLLMTAARTGTVECVQLLLKHGADVHAKERKGQTALMWAAHEGHAPVVRLLIDAGADFKSPLSSGFTPLIFAAREGRIEVAKLLIERGADVNEPTQRDKGAGGKNPRNGSSPLIMAVENGHFELAAELLKLGADPNDQRSGYTALHTLTWVRKPNRGDGDDGDPAPDGSGQLTSLDLVRLLKAHGADVNLRLERGPSGTGQLNRKGATALLLAAHSADLPYIKLLIELGADPQLNNNDGCTPLMAAAGIGVLAPGEEAGTEDEALAAIEYFFKLGLSVNTVDSNGETAMHGAAYKSLPRMVQWLDSHGADRKLWDKPNRYGWTPMAIAQGQRAGNFKPNEEVQAALKEIAAH